METLGLGYEGYHIEDNLKSKNLKWRKSIVLQLTPLRFCVKNQRKLLLSPPFASFDAQNYVMETAGITERHHIMKNLLPEVIDSGIPVPIDICQLLGNSDLAKKMTNETSSETSETVFESGINLSDFSNLRKKYDLQKLHFPTNSFQFDQLRITGLYFCRTEYPASPNNDNSKEAKKIIWSRLKNYIEYMANLGGSPVVCVGGSNKIEKLFKCKAAYRYKGDKKANCRLCPFKFTVKLDDYGYYIPLIAYPRRWKNNGCAWHNCKSTKKG